MPSFVQFSRRQFISPIKLVILLLTCCLLIASSVSCSRKSGSGFSIFPFNKKKKDTEAVHPDNEVYIPPPPGELGGDDPDSPPSMVGDLETGGEIPPGPITHDYDLLAEPVPIREETEAVNQLQTAFFEFDSSELSDEAKAILDDNIIWLKKHPNVEIQIQGHCDERGTIEYNFALGDRRAKSVKAYLIENGITAHQLRTISYGEERPIQGYASSDWDMNRRVQFMVFR
jgi:peptidoglycan-associated lipoprotein